MKCRICDNEERPEGHACALGTPENERHRLTLKERDSARAENAMLRARVEAADDLILRASELDGPIGDNTLARDCREYRRAFVGAAPSADSPVPSRDNDICARPKCLSPRHYNIHDPERGGHVFVEADSPVACEPDDNAKPARPDLYPSHRPITDDLAETDVRKQLGLASRMLGELSNKVRRVERQQSRDGELLLHLGQTGALQADVVALAAKVTALESGMNMHSECIGKLSEWAKTRERSPFREHPAAPPAPVATPHEHECGYRCMGDACSHGNDGACVLPAIKPPTPANSPTITLTCDGVAKDWHKPAPVSEPACDDEQRRQRARASGHRHAGIFRPATPKKASSSDVCNAGIEACETWCTMFDSRRWMNPKPETAGPGPHEYNASGPVAICWEPTGRSNDVCGRFKDDPIHAKDGAR